MGQHDILFQNQPIGYDKIETAFPEKVVNIMKADKDTYKEVSLISNGNTRKILYSESESAFNLGKITNSILEGGAFLSLALDIEGNKRQYFSVEISFSIKEKEQKNYHDKSDPISYYYDICFQPEINIFGDDTIDNQIGIAIRHILQELYIIKSEKLNL